MDWVEALARLRRDNAPAVLVTVAQVRGHAPRDAGATMVVGVEGTWGSVGGGNLEMTAVRRSRELLADPAAGPEVLELGLTERAPARHGRQCCGGQVKVLLTPVPSRPVVAVFGLGHVGAELARVLCRTEVRLLLVDTRVGQGGQELRDQIGAGAATVTVHHPAAPEVVVRDLPDGAHVLVLTHDHAEDLAIVDQALRRDTVGAGLGTIGVIGSAAKWARFHRRLRAEGHHDAVIARVRCPVGLPDLVSKDPAVIAVSVAADLLRTVGTRAAAAEVVS